MNAALIVMTILGCNDAGTDCHYIATADNRWPTIEMCDAVSEDQLAGYTNQPYPMIIAVCQKPEATGIVTAAVPQTEPGTPAPEQPAAPPEVTPQEKETLADRAIQRVKAVLPTTEGVKTLMTKPVRLVEDSYSWVARKLQR